MFYAAETCITWLSFALKQYGEIRNRANSRDFALHFLLKPVGNMYKYVSIFPKITEG